MIKLNILNLKNFLRVVDQCSGRVLSLSADGSKTDIREDSVQHKLKELYIKNGKCLPLTLEFDEPGDYMDVVAYYAGDC